MLIFKRREQTHSSVIEAQYSPVASLAYCNVISSNASICSVGMVTTTEYTLIAPFFKFFFFLKHMGWEVMNYSFSIGNV